jgi:hypothetical protein
MLEGGIDVVGDLYLPALLANQLLDPLPACVVEVLRVDRGLGAAGLGAKDVQPVGVIPVEVARGGLGHEVAVAVQDVVVRRLTGGDAADPVAGPVDGELADEARGVARVGELDQIVSRVVPVPLGVRAGTGEVDRARLVLPGRRFAGPVALAPGGRQQTVDRVVVEVPVEGVATDEELSECRIGDAEGLGVVENPAAR